jgi:hypothetical protein
MRRRGMIKTFGVIAVAIIVASVVLYAALRPPIGWPAEARRASHPAGFSIIVPEGWESHPTERNNPRSVDSLRLLPIKPVGSPGFFNVTRIPETPTDNELTQRGYNAATFAGKPAWTKESEQNSTREHTRNLLFQRDGSWFEIVIRRPASESLDSGSWQAYFESFRTETPRSATSTPALPATLPATLP